MLILLLSYTCAADLSRCFYSVWPRMSGVVCVCLFVVAFSGSDLDVFRRLFLLNGFKLYVDNRALFG